jgi:cytochrome P450
MEYLDQVLKGALRMYLCTYLLASRKCTSTTAHFAVEKDTMVPVLILKIHYDQEYYSNSDKFNPKHFKETHRKSRHCYLFIPSGEERGKEKGCRSKLV